MSSSPKTPVIRKNPLYKKAALIFGILAAGFAMFSITAFYAIPAHFIEGWIKEKLKERFGITVADEKFERVFPFGLSVSKVEFFNGSGKPFLYLDELNVKFKPLSIFTGNLKVGISAVAGGGELNGDFSIRPGGVALNLKGRQIGFNNFPILEYSGIKIDGAFNNDLSIEAKNGGCPTGYLDVKAEVLRGGEIRFMGYPLPVGDLQKAGAAVELGNCEAKVEGVWLEGSDLSARLQGEVTLTAPFSASPIDLSLELIPKENLIGKEFILSFINAYKRSANFYSVPVKGTIGNPAMVK
ncbi:MAG: type II secretion system protein GspN [Deltaproteobacteria bacterium]|nr:type II secretion system protein GspN [Deltaproteobacteria bacterium]